MKTLEYNPIWLHAVFNIFAIMDEDKLGEIYNKLTKNDEASLTTTLRKYIGGVFEILTEESKCRVRNTFLFENLTLEYFGKSSRVQY